MRAAVLSSHDLDGLTVAEVDVPAPGADEVLVRVDTVGVNQLDLNVIAGIGPGAQAQLPRILGIDPAGEIIAVGAGVDQRRIGQTVVVKPNIACGACARCQAGDEADCPKQTVVGVHRDGGAAEFVVVPARNAIDRHGLDAAQATAVVHSASIVINAVRTVALSAGTGFSSPARVARSAARPWPSRSVAGPRSSRLPVVTSHRSGTSRSCRLRVPRPSRQPSARERVSTSCSTSPATLRP